MAELISGTILAKSRKELLKQKIDESFIKYNRHPKLAVILVGDDAGSISYVKGKEKAALEVGIRVDTYHYENTITEDELVNKVLELNNDKTVDGILIQLPLPKHINKDYLLELINPNKDVDGFTSKNVSALYLKQKGLFPCTPQGVILMLESKGIKIEGKKAVVVGRSNIVGMPLAKMLLDKNATVTICHSKTENIKDIISQNDIVVAALGKARYITSDMIKDGAIVIDVGSNRDELGKLCGDVDYDNVKDKCSYISKVPGGVGPMTICCLLENTYEAYINNNGGNL